MPSVLGPVQQHVSMASPVTCLCREWKKLLQTFDARCTFHTFDWQPRGLQPSRTAVAATTAFVNWARPCPDECYLPRTSFHVWSRNRLEAKAGKCQTSGQGRNHARSTDSPWPSATQRAWVAEPPAAISRVVPVLPTLVAQADTLPKVLLRIISI